MDMKTDVEELLRDGMGRFTEGVRAPAGLAAEVASGTGGGWRSGSRPPAAAWPRSRRRPRSWRSACRPAARRRRGHRDPGQDGYLPGHPGEAGAGRRAPVFYGRTNGTYGPSVTWVYGPRSRWEELTGTSCGHALPNGDCTHQGGSERFLAQGTARVGGKLTGVYVTYYNREWSLSPETVAASACSTTARLEMGGAAGRHQSLVIVHQCHAGLRRRLGDRACLDQRPGDHENHREAGHGPPAAGRTPRRSGRSGPAVEWTLYVNPKTYLPVRIVGSTSDLRRPAGQL